VVGARTLRGATSLRRIARGALALVLFAGVGIATLVYPLERSWLAALLALYALAIGRYRALGLPAVLALLPLLDLAPQTGWLFLNEFDLLVAVTLGVRLLQAPPIEGARLSAAAKAALAIVTCSFLVSAVIGLLPLRSMDANAFFGPYSGFAALRQLKGFLWALALLPLLTEAAADREGLERRWATGMLLGLIGVDAVILWQRVVFAGLLDFAQVYRVEGPFPELHTGGGDVHGYLVVAIPFIVAWAGQRPDTIRIALAGVLFIVATYAVGVTFTRGAYVGYAVAFIVVSGALLRQGRPTRSQLARSAAIAGLGLAGVVVLLPILTGTFMEARLAGTQVEAMTRTRHWARALAMMDDDFPTRFFGMGLGAFPRTFFFKQPTAASATFGYEREGENRYLRLGSGRSLYLDQRVAVAPHRLYTVSLDMRSADPSATLNAMLCEKSLQYSFHCQTVAFQVQQPAVWTHREATLASGPLGAAPWLLSRPVALSLTNPGLRSIVDVDNVHLRDAEGRDLIANGDFADGGARWFFAADDHLPWHIFNLGVEILFEQGWAGVLAVAWIVLLAVPGTGVATFRGDLYAGGLLASMAGFLAVGLTESLFDGPRVTTLFFLLLFLGLVRSGPSRIEPRRESRASVAGDHE
jgi:hypothetical protein